MVWFSHIPLQSSGLVIQDLQMLQDMKYDEIFYVQIVVLLFLCAVFSASHTVVDYFGFAN